MKQGEKETVMNYGIHKRWKFLVMIALVTGLALSRMYRNSFLFYSEQTGGMWNYITLFFIPYMIVSGLRNKKYYLNKETYLLLGYAIFVILLEIVHRSSFGINALYYTLIGPYFVYVLIASRNSWYPKDKIVTMVRIAYFLVASLCLYEMIGYNLGIFKKVLVSDVYYLLCLLPLFLAVETNKAFLTLAIGSAGIATMFSSKRAGLIIYITVLFAFFVASNGRKRNLKFIKKMMLYIVVILVMLLVYLQLSDKYDLRILWRMTMIIETGGAGRLGIYGRVITAFFSSEIHEMLFGHGAGAVSDIPGVNVSSAHNDFLEIMYERGLIALIFFGVWTLSLVKKWMEMRKNQYPLANVYLSMLIVSLVLSMVSTYYVSFGYVTCGVFSLGWFLEDYRMFKKEKDGNYNEVNYCYDTASD